MITIAIVPAYNAAAGVGHTVAALREINTIDRILVVDDASSDNTAEVARAAGAEVAVLPYNQGKGGAVLAGVAASPDADVFLLVDADLRGTASETRRLLDPILADEADLVIAVLPPAAGRGGFGAVKNLARRGIKTASGYDARSPLSGQRAIRAPLLRQLADADRFGLEVAMTIDAARAGARIVEIETEIEHDHTGRSLGGFRHRGQQGLDIWRSLWPRITTERQRIGAIGLITMLLLGLMLWSGTRWAPTTTPLAATPKNVVVFGFAPFDFTVMGGPETPVLNSLPEKGALGAMTVRTLARRPAMAEGYLSLGAGARLRASGNAALAYPVNEVLDEITAGETLSEITGEVATGEIAVVGAVNSVRVNQGVEVASPPGALASVLSEAGLETAVVGVADRSLDPESEQIERPLALAAMDENMNLAAGNIDPAELLVEDVNAPFGVTSNHRAMLAALDTALDEAAVVFIDPGDLQRSARYRPTVLSNVADEARLQALASTDALLGQVLDQVGPETLVLVVAVTPIGGFRLTPVFAVGDGVPAGTWISSPSTKRTGLSAITDIAPTIVSALTGNNPTSFPGNPLRYESGPVNLADLEQYDRDTIIRERTYYPQALVFITIQAVIYAGALLVLSTRRDDQRANRATRWSVLAVVSYPVATFLVKFIPSATQHVALPTALAVLFSMVIATISIRRRGHPLAAFEVVLALTVAVLLFDASTGTKLHLSSWLGYSLHSAGRFYGMPNTTFAVFGAATILLASSWVYRAKRRHEALFMAAALFFLVTVANGIPFLGGDVGGIITFVPVFTLTLMVLAGGRLGVRTLLLVGLGTLVVLLAVAGLDLLRPEENRTHLGRFAAQMLDEGFQPLVQTFLRKQAANFRIFRVSIWTWMIPIVVSFALYLLVWARGWTKLLPLGSPLRVGAISVMSAALLGFIANDSGPVVIALFLVYLLAYLATVSLDVVDHDLPVVVHGPRRSSTV